MSELKLEEAEGRDRQLYNGNSELGALCFNYVKCLALDNGYGNTHEFLKSDSRVQKALQYLTKVSPQVA